MAKDDGLAAVFGIIMIMLVVAAVVAAVGAAILAGSLFGTGTGAMNYFRAFFANVRPERPAIP